MKNYKVKAIMKFTDKEEDTKRIVDDEFFCTKERYEYLKSNGAVTLIEIVEEKEELVATKEIIIEKIPNATGEVVVALLNDEKPKKKKSSKR